MRLQAIALGLAGALSSALALGAFTACSSSPGEATPTDGDGGGGEEASAEEGPVCPESGVSKGPWTLAMTRTSVKVRWEACRADAKGGIVFRPEAGGPDEQAPSATKTVELKEKYFTPLNPNSPPDWPGTYTMHEALPPNLTPGTCYRYELVADRKLGGRFCTSQPDGKKVHFMAIADTNPLLGTATANVLSRLLPLGPDFTVHAGDIQYYDSGLETWAGWFPAMRPLLANGALMAAIGNHELEKDDELASYALRFFGDSTTGSEDGYYEFESGGVHFFALNSEGSIAPESPQGLWLLGRLDAVSKRPGYRASVVFLHKPLVTCGDTGQDDASRNRYAPVFVEKKVLVIQGHMHGYERFELDGITYVTTGGGGGALGKVDQNASRAECAARKSAGAFHHAVDLTFEGGTLEGRTIDAAGAVRDTFRVTLTAP
jgi:calcineurin-like phosphoesterase family protein